LDARSLVEFLESLLDLIDWLGVVSESSHMFLLISSLGVDLAELEDALVLPAHNVQMTRGVETITALHLAIEEVISVQDFIEVDWSGDGAAGEVGGEVIKSLESLLVAVGLLQLRSEQLHLEVHETFGFLYHSWGDVGALSEGTHVGLRRSHGFSILKTC
jgi:hypothetical protein